MGEIPYNDVIFNFRLDEHCVGENFKSTSPSRNSGELQIVDSPTPHPVPDLPETPNEHSPGLTDLNR